MSKTNKILVGLLALQAVLAVVTWASGGGRGASDARPLLEIGKEAVTALTIEAAPRKEGEAPERVELVKKGNDWVVASAADYPAQKDKVEEVVGKLVALKVRQPLATQKANHAALNVGEKDFDRRVTLQAGTATHQLVIGSGKGSSVHARFADQDDVFLARGMSSWALGERASTYIDTQYIKVDEPTSILVVNDQGGVLNLLKDDQGDWLVPELPPDAKVDPGRVSAFVSSARSVRLAEPVGKEVKPEYGLDKGTRVTLKAGDQTTSYAIGAAKGDQHYVKADDNEYVVLVSKYSVESLRTQTPDKFLKDEAPAQAAMPGHGMPDMHNLPPELQEMLRQQGAGHP